MSRYGRASDSLRDALDYFMFDASEGEVAEVANQLEENELASRNSRWQAASTQSRQDRVLEFYYTFLRAILLRSQHHDSSDKELLAVAFPSDLKRLWVQLKKFMEFVYYKSIPRSKKTGERIQWSTLGQFRLAMMFWARKVFVDRDEEPPPQQVLFFHMTDAMRSAVQNHGDPNMKKTEKTYIGLAELRQLIDVEMMRNICIANSE